MFQFEGQTRVLNLTMNPEVIEGILESLLIPSNEILADATKKLKNAFRDPKIIPILCTILSNSANTQNRQYAAVLLRRKVNKRRKWNKIDKETRQGLKCNILQALQAEPEKQVKNAVAQLAGTVAKLEMPTNSWPELLQYLHASLNNNEVLNREVGIFTLSIVASSAAEQLQPHVKGLLHVFGRTLQDQGSIAIPFYTIKALTALTFVIGSEELYVCQSLIPKVLLVLKHLVAVDEEKACEAMQLFDELIECEVGVLAPHVRTVVDFCLELGKACHLGADIRCKALTVVSWLVRLKKKTILKNKLITPILRVAFPIMCEPSDRDEESEEDAGIPMGDTDSCSPSSVSAQLIDIMALHLPPEKLLQPLMQFVEPAFSNQNPFCRKAAYIALAVTAEGCSDCIQKKHLQLYVQCAMKGIMDGHVIVRSAAMFALGQFSEHLQPNIAKFAGDVLPILFESLRQICDRVQAGQKMSSSVTKLFYALENFCESLALELIPYLPAVMDQLFTAMNCNSVAMQELAISAIGASASGVQENISPYFDRIMGYLQQCLSNVQTEETLPVQIQALGTLSVLARSVGHETFLPFVPQCLDLGLSLIQSFDDPDLRRSTYGLFASISTVLKDGMKPYLPSIMEHMVDSLMSNEGYCVSGSEDPDTVGGDWFEDISDEEDEDGTGNEMGISIGQVDDSEDEEDGEDEEGVGMSVENSFLSEKEETCDAIKEIAANCGVAFLPFLENTAKEVYNLLDHPVAALRESATKALGQFCCTLYTGVKQMPADEPNYHEKLQASFKMLHFLLPKLTLSIREDKERLVAMASLEVINNMVKVFGTDLTGRPGNLDLIVNVVKDVMQSKVACQDQTEVDSAEDLTEDEDAEHDAMLIEFAGELLPSLAQAVPDFSVYFAGFLHIFIAKLNNSSNIAEKSFTVGTLAECVCGLRKSTDKFVEFLYPAFLSAARDADEEVRSNAIFGLGVLAEHGGEQMYSHYGEILQLLSNTLRQESDDRVLDNVCATVSRLILTNVTLVPIDQILPVLMHYLPLRKDFCEYVVVFNCLTYLISLKNDQVLRSLPHILSVIAQVSSTKLIKPETQTAIDQLVQEIGRN